MSRHPLLRRDVVVCAFAILWTLATVCLDDSWASDRGVGSKEKRIVFISGPCSHPSGTHEAAAGARLLKYCIDNAQNIGSVKTALYDPWPERSNELDETATIVFLGDLFPPARLAKEKPEIEAKLKTLMEQGLGIVCLHYATGLQQVHLPADGEHPLLACLGGYFAHGCTQHQSLHQTCRAEFTPAEGDHPICRGWKAFTFREEVYYNVYFGKQRPAENVAPIVCCMMPPEKPKKEIVGWAVTRADGGRGVGFTAPHFYQNWQLDDMRTLVLNSIVWSAKIEVPHDGVNSPAPNLNTFRR